MQGSHAHCIPRQKLFRRCVRHPCAQAKVHHTCVLEYESLVIVAVHAGCCCQQSVVRQVICDTFRGQINPDGASVPELSSCQALDFELEMVTSHAT